MIKILRSNRNLTSFKKLLSLLIISTLLLSCGHKKSPTGGKKDTEKPTILNIFPDELSDITDSNIEITFSKPIDRSTILAGIHFYPMIFKKKFKWDKNTLIIKILEDLEQNTNYFLSFSEKIKGEHGNKLDKNYVFIYKSGKLSNNRISGNISYEDKTDIGKEIKLILQTADSTFIFSRKLQGNAYELDNLNNIEHILEAYIDKNDNNKYNDNSEPFFQRLIPPQKISNIDIELAYADTVKPLIKSANVPSNNQIVLEFSETILKYDDINIFTADSLRIPVPVKMFSLKSDKLSIISGKLDTLKYEVSISNLEDKKNNVNVESNIIIMGTSVQDTIPPEVLSVNPRNGSSVNTLLPEIEIIFSEIIFQDSIKAEIIGLETNKEIRINIIKGDSERYLFQSNDELINYASYKFILEASDPNGNRLEELFEVVFIPIVR